MELLIINIACLINTREESMLLRGKDLADLPCIQNAFLLVDEDVIAEFGYMYELEIKLPVLPKHILDASNQFIMPCWCDSHTHLVFAGTRENEFIDKIKGLTYLEIAEKGGGILNSADKINAASEDELYVMASKRISEVASLGTGAIEIKSGYGLSAENEIKMLRVIKRLKDNSGLLIKSTFLGAHAYPLAYRNDHAGYLRIIIEEMLPVIGAEELADYIDVFCETGFFSPGEMETICNEGKKYGLKAKLHVNQLSSIGGIQAAVDLKALSADHLETMTDEEIKIISSSETIATLLPSAAFFLRMDYPPARKLITSGAAIALASDFNPGSSPSGNMNLVLALSCIQMKMLPNEAINAATMNGAYAMGVEHQAGSITIGKKANLIFTKPIPSISYLFYAFGSNLIDKVMINGIFIKTN
ncbi:MAG: imidazolonepropionase [Ferruginibacter sp.]